MRGRLCVLFVVALVTSTFAVVGSAPSPVGAAPPALQWVAMGDSYSAGVGLGAVDLFGCDRDGGAYAPRAARLLRAGGRTVAVNNVACTGATTQDVVGQYSALSSSTNLVTLTIGGDDIGFATKVSDCFVLNCGEDLMGLYADVRANGQTWDDLFALLVSQYGAVRNRMSSTGHLVVLSYPMPFAPASSSCEGLVPLEQQAANALVNRLDDTIYWAVQRANELRAARGLAGNVHFVDWRTGTRVEGGYTPPVGPDRGRTFATQSTDDGLCNGAGRTPFINGFTDYAWTGIQNSNSFHPNETGYGYAASIVAEKVRQLFPDQTPPTLSGTFVSTCNLGGADRCTGVNLRSVPVYPGNVIGTLPERAGVDALCWSPGTRIRDAGGHSDDRWAWVRSAGGGTGYVSFMFLWGTGFTIPACGPFPGAAGNAELTGDLRQEGQAVFRFPVTNDGYFAFAPRAMLVGVREPSGAVTYHSCNGGTATIAKGATWVCEAAIDLPALGHYQGWLAWDDASGRHDSDANWDGPWMWDFDVDQGPLQGVSAQALSWDTYAGGSVRLRHVVRNVTGRTLAFPSIHVGFTDGDGVYRAVPCVTGRSVTLAPGQELTCDTTHSLGRAGSYRARLEYVLPSGAEYAGAPLFSPDWSIPVTDRAEPAFQIESTGVDLVDPVVGGQFHAHYTVRNTGASRGRILPAVARDPMTAVQNVSCAGVDYVHIDTQGVVLDPNETFTCDYTGTFLTAGLVTFRPDGYQLTIGEFGVISQLFQGEPPIAVIDVAPDRLGNLIISNTSASAPANVGGRVHAEYTITNRGTQPARLLPVVERDPTSATSGVACDGVDYDHLATAGVVIAPGASWTCVHEATVRESGTVTLRPHAYRLAADGAFLGSVFDDAPPIATFDIAATPATPPPDDVNAHVPALPSVDPASDGRDKPPSAPPTHIADCTGSTSPARRWVSLLYIRALFRCDSGPNSESGVAQFEPDSIRQTFARVVFRSTEGTRKFTAQGYELLLHRSPDPGGSAFWTGHLHTGTRYDQFESTLIGSNEYFNRAGATNAKFVNAVYHDLLTRAPHGAETTFWVNRLAAGTTRTHVALTIDRSSQRRRIIADTWGYGYVLHRSSTLAELNFWSAKQASGIDQLDLSAAFTASDEAAAKASTPGF